MNTMYEPVMGLEVHVELNTKSKMFCRCSADYFGKEPNSLTCPVCLGLPGALPFTNGAAIEKCVQIGLALGCRVNQKSLFERKNYFYPDLPKGYQISQLRWPLCTNGSIEVEDEDGNLTKIRINRVHQEEDTAKLTHQLGISNFKFPISNESRHAEGSVIDFNRSGVPLVEIVTEPDFKDPIQVRNYAKLLQQIFRDLGVSNADMEKGDMRLEANISVRPIGQTELPNYRVEMKNINSFRFMVAAIEYEIKRQIKALEKGEKLHQETRGWNEEKAETFLQRSKEEANDYRYFPEPDLPELDIQESRIKELELRMPKLTTRKLSEYSEKFGFNKVILKSLASEPRRIEVFEELMARDNDLDAVKTANTLINLPSGVLAQLNIEELLNQIRQKGVGLIDDEVELERLAKEVIIENPAGAVDSYKAGKLAAIGVLIGSLMKKTSGKADPGKSRAILERLLK